MGIPSTPISLMSKVYTKIIPNVHRELDYWKSRAMEIPNEELRTQALLSIKYKTFHCEGGAIMAILAGENYREAIRFIVAYQTISDYLDNLCDRSTSLDADDFTALHEAMEDGLTIGAKSRNYYRHREDQDDGGYLTELSQTCQQIVTQMPNYKIIESYLHDLCDYYCNLQIHKHVIEEERVPRLKKWFKNHKNDIPNMSWYEFSACSGSTLGVFCLMSYAMREDFTPKHAEDIHNGYFPYIQGLHILLDYFIDQEEDIAGGDLNFCFYYNNEEHLFDRLKHFIVEADRHTKHLPHKRFHKLINRGLLGIYLSDEKVRQQRNVFKMARKMMRFGGPTSLFFYINGRLYRTFQKFIPAIQT